MKNEKTFVCACVGGEGVVTQWYCSEGEGHVVNNHHVEYGDDPEQHMDNRRVNISSSCGCYKGLRARQDNNQGDGIPTTNLLTPWSRVPLEKLTRLRS
jgi:hypothetical protein